MYATQKFKTMQFQAFLSQFLEAFLENAFTYALFAFPFFLAFWIIWKKRSHLGGSFQVKLLRVKLEASWINQG
jgi:hypothetical protein